MPSWRKSPAARVYAALSSTRPVIVAAALLACSGASDSTGPGGGGGGGGAAQITITPNAPSITVGSQMTLQAEVRGANGQVISGATVFWSSADTNIVTVSAVGVITGKSIGNTQIAASSNGASAVATVTVVQVPVASVAILPPTATIAVGGSLQLQAIAYDSASHTLSGRSIVWASSAPSVAKVDPSGMMTGLGAGSATITATVEGKTGSSTIAVFVSASPVKSVAITPSNPSVDSGSTITLTATPRDSAGNALSQPKISWITNDATIATVSTNGVVTGISVGNVAITAACDGVAASVIVKVIPVPVSSVTLTPPTAALVTGSSPTAPFTVTLKDAQGHVLTGRAISWSSGKTSVATVDPNSGLVTAVDSGSAMITATSEGKAGSATVNVTLDPVSSVALTPSSAGIVTGASPTAPFTVTLKDAQGNVLTGRAISWSSSDPTKATVNSTTGLVTAVDSGTTIITATSEGKSGSATVVVSLVPVSLVTVTVTSPIASGQTTTASAVPSDANGNALTGRKVTWSTSDPTIATIDQTGLVTPVTPITSAVSVNIIATIDGTVGSASLVITP